jgi:hypothetical protein
VFLTIGTPNLLETIKLVERISEKTSKICKNLAFWINPLNQVVVQSTGLLTNTPE